MISAKRNDFVLKFKPEDIMERFCLTERQYIYLINTGHLVSYWKPKGLFQRFLSFLYPSRDYGIRMFSELAYAMADMDFPLEKVPEKIRAKISSIVINQRERYGR